jgi:hypothetical protein
MERIMRRSLAIGAILSALLGLFPPLAAAQPSGARLCFEPSKTTKCIEGRFLDQWNAHGGLAINGYPLTDERVEILEDGREYWVQWFERVRMEYHPDNRPQYQVLLGQFGRAIHPADPPVGPQPGMRHFGETGHNVPPDFLAYWDANGGLPQFGFPLSEVFRERLENGQEYEVQYFERARFERHPGNPPGSNILLGQFGRRILNAPWGPVVASLGSGFFAYNDPQGRFTARIPEDWTLREDGPANNVYHRKPGGLWGAEIALNDGRAFSTVEQADRVIDQQLRDWLQDYRPMIHERVNIGPHRAHRRVFQHTNVEGQTEIIVRIYFLSGPWLYQVNGFMLPDQRSRVEHLVDGLAGSIATNP